MNKNDIDSLRRMLAISQEYHETVLKLVALRNEAIEQFQAALNTAAADMYSEERMEFYARVWAK